MDSDKGWQASYKGFGGHVWSRLAGFQSLLSLWILIGFKVLPGFAILTCTVNS